MQCDAGDRVAVGVEPKLYDYGGGEAGGKGGARSGPGDVKVAMTNWRMVCRWPGMGWRKEMGLDGGRVCVWDLGSGRNNGGGGGGGAQTDTTGSIGQSVTHSLTRSIARSVRGQVR